MTDFRNKETGKYDSYAFPGGYEIEYITTDGDVLCANCANCEMSETLNPDNSWFVVGAMLDCEHDEPQFCAHCGHAFDAYGVLESTPAAQHDENE